MNTGAKPREYQWSLTMAALGYVTTVVAMLLISSAALASSSASIAGTGQVLWQGNATNARVGDNGVANIGDLNSDGINDVAITSSDSSNRGVAVLFTPPDLKQATNISTALPPSSGYLIKTSTVPVVAPIGDQNDDGVPDVLVGLSGTVYVIYGVADPSSLPQCSAPAAQRCIDLTATLSPSNGYRLTSATSSFGIRLADAGDVNGDGVDDILTSANNDNATAGSVFVVFGGRAAPESGDPVNVDGLPASEAVKINGPAAGAKLGVGVYGVGDLDGDGLADVAAAVTGISGPPAAVYVIYGSVLSGSPIETSDFGPSMGYRVSSDVLGLPGFINAGDVNLDGRPDTFIAGAGVAAAAGFASLTYGVTEPPVDPISNIAPTADQGYAYAPNLAGSGFGLGANTGMHNLSSAGDLNGDGIPDQMVGAPNLSGTGLSGSVYLLFGRNPAPSGPPVIGSDMTADTGISLTGPSPSNTGKQVDAAGDVDGDGLPDYFIAAPTTPGQGGISSAGSIYLVLGSSLVPLTKTGGAAAISSSGATVTGAVGKSQGVGSAHFEYGPTTEYGDSTETETVSGAEAVNFDLSGLQPKTEYHYRLVATNALGLTRYGADRTFMTAAVPPDRCEQDNTLPGCSGYSGEKFCQDSPAAEICKPAVAGLSNLIANSQAVKVRRGRTVVVWAQIVSTGGKSADGVTVCASAPKSKAKIVGKGCRTTASLAPGKTTKVKFKLKAKARRGAKVKVMLTASAQGVSKRTATVRLTVR